MTDAPLKSRLVIGSRWSLRDTAQFFGGRQADGDRQTKQKNPHTHKMTSSNVGLHARTHTHTQGSESQRNVGQLVSRRE